MKLHYTEMEQRKEFELPSGPFTVGRNKVCGLSIKDLSISKQHCECKLEGGKMLIRDMGSRNGTWVNGDRIGDQFVPVGTSDQLIIGKLDVKLSSGAVAPPAPLATTQQDEAEGTVFDADFGSSAAWSQSPQDKGAAQGQETQKWNQSVEVAAEISSGDYSNMLRGEIHEPGLPPARMTLNPGAHVAGGEPACSVRLSANGVSSRHAQFSFDGGQWWVEDLGSRNGTYINKHQLSQRTAIKPGDQIFIGPVRIEIARTAGSGPVPVMAAPGVALAADPGLAPPKAGPSKALMIAGGVFVLLIVLGLAAKMMKPGKPGPGKQPVTDNPMVAFESNLKAAVVALQANEFQTAKTHLGICNQLRAGEDVVTRLLSVGTWKSENPTSHIVELIDAGRYLKGQKHPLFIRAGVADYGKQLHDIWFAEQVNATHAAKGEEAYARDDWVAAYRLYDKIGRESPFRAATRARAAKARKNIAQQLLDEGQKAYKRGDADLALQKFAEATKFAGPGMQNKILNLEQKVKRNVGYSRLLSQAREAFNSGSLEACIERCDKIAKTSDYYAEAAKLREQAQRILTEKEATRLYHAGNGSKAIKMLTSYPSLKAFREKIQQVLDLYGKADKLYEAKNYEQANPLWNSLVAIETNPQNWYVIQAVKKKQVDPKKLAAAMMEKAKRLNDSNKKVEAAQKCFEALGFDGANKDALEMRKKMLRDIKLKYSILAQKWKDKHAEVPDDAAFLKAAALYRDWLKAIDPSNELRPKLEKDWAKAGGK